MKTLYMLISPTQKTQPLTKNSANQVNTTIVNKMFSAQKPSLCVQLDCDLPPMLIYKGMQMVLTENRDKQNGIVNGQSATVIILQ